MQSLSDAPIIIILMDSPVLVWSDPSTYYPILWSTAKFCPAVGVVAIDFDGHSQSASHPLKKYTVTTSRVLFSFQSNFTDPSGFLREESSPCQC